MGDSGAIIPLPFSLFPKREILEIAVLILGRRTLGKNEKTRLLDVAVKELAQNGGGVCSAFIAPCASFPVPLLSPGPLVSFLPA